MAHGQTWFPVFVNKVLLGPSHAYMCVHCLWLLPHCNDRSDHPSRRPYGLQSLSYLLTLWSFIEKLC